MHRFLSLTLVAAACGGPAAVTAPPAVVRPTVDVHAAAESDVNAYVVSDGRGTVIIDATRSSSDARAVAALARTRGDGPVTLLITHGHPDHFLGIGALAAELPGLRVVVARQEIEDDIVGMASWMAGEGWLEHDPAMKPRTEANPDGFDYAGTIEVLPEPRLVLPGGAVLELTSDYAPTEAAHMTTIYSRDLGALFTSDLAYHDVHAWLGVGVTVEAATTWQRTLTRLEADWRSARPTIYPGHGAPTDLAVLAATRRYIGDLLEVARASATDEAARDAMIARYPDHANRDFLLAMSIANQRALAAASAE